MSPLSPTSGLVSYCAEDTFSGRTQEGLYRTASPLPAHPYTFPIPSSLTFLPERGLRLNDWLRAGLCFLKLLLPPEGLWSPAKMFSLDVMPPPDSACLRSFPSICLGGEFRSRGGWTPVEGEVVGRYWGGGLL